MGKYMDLPHDDIVERGIFSILLFAADKIPHVIDLLTPADFYVPSHQQLWQAMIQLFKDGRAIDMPSLRMQLHAQDTDPKPALQVLVDAQEDEVQLHHLADFIKDVKNKSTLRNIVKLSNSHTFAAQVDGVSAREVLTGIEMDFLQLVDKSLDPAPVDAAGIITEVQADIAQGIKDGWKGFDTRFRVLDEFVGGLIPSQTWIIGADTGIGKTFFILQLLLNVLRQDGRVMIFSTEMDRKLNMLRMIGNLAELGTVQMIRNRLNDEEVRRMQTAQQTIAAFGERLIIYDNVYLVDEIRLKIKKQLLSGGVNVVAVDYIQMLKGKADGGIYERMSEVARDLYRMTQELKITTLLGSQITKSKTSENFKGAGEIEEVADVALRMKKLENGNRQLLLQKVRHGQSGKAYAKLEFPSGRFIDIGGEGIEKDNTDIAKQLEEEQ